MSKHRPYNQAVISLCKEYKIPKIYWDYNFKIDGIVYEISVDQDTGMLFINKDEDQND